MSHSVQVSEFPEVKTMICDVNNQSYKTCVLEEKQKASFCQYV